MRHIDLENDTLVSVYKLSSERFGKRPSPATIWRWVRKGRRGVRLEAVNFCGTWQTTPRAFAAFIEECTAATLEGGATARVTDVTDEMLRAEGLL